jgi:hypothetical protein
MLWALGVRGPRRWGRGASPPPSRGGRPRQGIQQGTYRYRVTWLWRGGGEGRATEIGGISPPSGYQGEGDSEGREETQYRVLVARRARTGAPGSVGRSGDAGGASPTHVTL